MRDNPVVRIATAGLSVCLLLVVSGCERPMTDQEQEGQYVYEVHCSECHDNNQLGLKVTPPDLHRLFAAKTLPDGVTATSDAAVRDVVIHGKRTMPAFDQRIGDQQLSDLMAYLHRK